ncbi:MAG: MBL fold metallo-hydrolase [Gammaproteobacteria bacterium]|nr:MBL fold metallo-hydrolase [Gammaproteobacteria bacterium]
MKHLAKTLTVSSLLLTSIGWTANSLADSPAEITRIADAMGGLERLRSVSNQTVSADITGIAPLQAPVPGGEPERFDNITYTITRALDGERFNTHWTLDIEFPLKTHYAFTEIINGEHGAVLGVDSILQTPQAPMQAIRLGARKINHFVTSPVAVVKAMLAAPTEVVLLGSLEHRERNETVLAIKKYGKDIQLWIDNNTHLPIKASYWDSNPSYGDTQIVTQYSDWQDAAGIKVPMLIKQSDQGMEMVRIQRRSVEFDIAFIADPFEVPASLNVDLDTGLYNIGVKYANWFHRYLLVGIPFDLNQYSPESVFLHPVGDGVFYLQGFTHHSLIVEMSDYLVLFDPVLLEERTQLVLPVIKQQWPNKKIKYVVPTHFHVDHSGGLRGYVADGAQLVTTERNEDFYENVLKSKHIVYPDLLALMHKKARMLEINDGETYVIDDGERRIHLLQIANRHAPGLIAPYIEDQKILFISDLYSPGFFTAPIPPQFSYWGLDLYNDLLPRKLEIKTIIGAHGGMGSFQDFIDAMNLTFPEL